jgi:amidase/aspartyl-tRNA(Asn)/glutamyl-tRNA(Gln) amidotransferase subunit A
MQNASATDIARAVAGGTISATEVARNALDRIKARDGRLNSFTELTTERALAEAASIDTLRAGGHKLPPLAGVPYAVKNLFDIKGLATLAGSKINRDLPPAVEDAQLVRRMRAAGAVLVGALNMDEYAYGFTTENTHYGTTRNPHDLARIAGGSSGGSAAAVAGGLVPLSLGTDTNGSIRVPSSLCGIFGIKPTYGRLSRRGTYPFVASLDHVGPFARTVRDLATCYDALQGQDAADPACAQRAFSSTTGALADAGAVLRIARLGGYFEHYAGPDAQAAVAAVVKALQATRMVELPEVERARAAAFVITAHEGAQLHLPDLKTRPHDFEPLIRDRLLAGALVPAAWYVQAQRFRSWFCARAMELLRDNDILIAASTPVSADLVGTETFTLNGEQMLLRPSMGLLTQPISFIGLPVVAVPVVLPGKLPIGVQIIAAPWREDHALRVAARLEREGVCAAPVANL